MMNEDKKVTLWLYLCTLSNEELDVHVTAYAKDITELHIKIALWRAKYERRFPSLTIEKKPDGLNFSPTYDLPGMVEVYEKAPMVS